MRIPRVRVGSVVPVRVCSGMVRKRCRVVHAGAAPAFVGLLLSLAGASPAQVLGPRGSTPVPVYADDSTSARDALARLPDLIAGGNEGEAVRSLQRLLDEAGDRVLEVEGDADLYISVREHVHRRLLANPELLERYRRAQEPEAARQLERGRERQVEQTRLLTPSGYEAALRVAQLQLEAARFDAARFTLLQLESHPDRRARSGQDAAELMALLARLTEREDVRLAAERWAAETGLDRPIGDRFDRPPGVGAPRLDPTDASPKLDLSDIVARPIQSVSIDPDLSAGGLIGITSGPWALPAIIGDELYVSDGVRVVAFERFTLNQRWSTKIADAIPRGAGATDRFRRRAERPVQPRSVAVSENLVFATSGHGPNFEADRPDFVHALDRRTGELVWRFHPGLFDSQLSSAEADGIVRYHEGTVLVAAQNRPDDRRLWSYRLFGLDASTGEVRWLRLIGTAGSIGWGAAPVRPAVQRVRDGVVYRSDSFGLISAFETETGRVRWVRRRPVEAYGVAPDLRPSLAPAPEFIGDRLMVMSGDSRAILLLDAETGELHRTIDSMSVGGPALVLAMDDWIALIGSNRVHFLPAEDPDPINREVLGPPVPLDALTGRPLTDGKLLLLPTAAGLGVVDPGNPLRVERIELDRAGVILAAEAQVLVASPDRLHSYLAWDSAQRTLRRRLDANADDPEPALTLAELAHLAGRNELIEDAVAELIERLPRIDADDAERIRRRAFRSVLEMVEPTGRRAERTGLAIEIRAGLMPKLTRLASSPEEKVSGLLAQGALAEATDDGSAAIGFYQQILADAELASANWRGPGAVLRADMETTRRVRQVLNEFGGDLYEPFEREARREASRLGADADAPSLIRVASRFPASSVAPELLLRASDRAGREHEAERALLAALDALIERARAGMTADPNLAGEVAGRLATAMVAQRRPQAAARVMERSASAFPDAALTARGEPVETDDLFAQVATVLNDLRWRPRIGTETGRPSAMLENAKIAAPLLTLGAPVAPGYALLIREESIALVEPDNGDPSRIRERWSREACADSALLRADRESLIIHDSCDDGPRITRIDAESGRGIWSRRIDGDLLDHAGESLTTLRLIGDVRADDVVAAATDRTLVLARRAGGMVAVDIKSGATLWRAEQNEAPTHSLVAGAGVVAIGTQDTSLDAIAGVRVFDERTGEPVAELTASELLPGGLRWMRLTDTRTLLVGLDDRVVAYDLTRGEQLWTHAGEETDGSVDAWVTGGRVAVLSPERTLTIIDIETGNRLAERAQDAVFVSSGQTRLVQIGEQDAFVSASGVLVLNEKGEITGRDAVSGAGAIDSFAMPGVAAEGFVLVDRRGRAGAASRVRIADSTGRFVSRPTALILRDDDEAERVEVLEGVVLVQTRLGVIVLPAPVAGLSG